MNFYCSRLRAGETDKTLKTIVSDYRAPLSGTTMKDANAFARNDISKRILQELGLDYLKEADNKKANAILEILGGKAAGLDPSWGSY